MVFKELANQYRKIQADIIESRNTWEKKTKPFIIDILEGFKETTQLNVVIDVDNSIYQHEIVSLVFPAEACGLSYNEISEKNVQNDRHGEINLVGGALMFNQRYNGQVAVWMYYPHIDFAGHEHERKLESIGVFCRKRSIKKL